MGKNQDPGSGINIPDPPHCGIFKTLDPGWKNSDLGSATLIRTYYLNESFEPSRSGSKSSGKPLGKVTGLMARRCLIFQSSRLTEGRLANTTRLLSSSSSPSPKNTTINPRGIYSKNMEALSLSVTFSFPDSKLFFHKTRFGL
jgi:hypothetical protein